MRSSSDRDKIMDDWSLLKQYVEHGSQEAFDRIVQEHTDLVYSSALRRIRDPHLAEDVTQAVFLVLARKAAALKATAPLAAWLFTTTRYAAAEVMRRETRRREREMVAAEEHAKRRTQEAGTTWDEIMPRLDQAIDQLGRRDRDAILLRFFQKKTHKQVGAELGISAVAAEKRVSRAVDRLRGLLAKCGVRVVGAILAGMLTDNAVQAAPPALAGAVAHVCALDSANAAAVNAGQAAGRVIRMMWWLKAKTMITAACGVLLVSSGIVGAIAAGLADPGVSIPLVVDTGFYDRKDALVQADVDFGQPVRPDSLSLVRGGDSKPVKFRFIPGEPGRGRLLWLLSGYTPSLEQVRFTLKGMPGEWSSRPVGDHNIVNLARAYDNLVVDGDFEVSAPAGWNFRACEVSGQQAHSGKRSLKIIGNGKFRGRAWGPVFVLEPATRYMISYWVKFARADKIDSHHGAISVSLNYLGPDRKRLFPRNYYINRHQLAYLTNRHFKAEYLGRWIKVRSVRATLPGARFGRIEIGTSYAGEVFLDELVIRKVPPAEPVTVKAGPAITGGR